VEDEHRIDRSGDDACSGLGKLTIKLAQFEEDHVQSPSAFARLNDGGVTFGKARLAEGSAQVAGCLEVRSNTSEASSDPIARVMGNQLESLTEGHAATRALRKLVEELFVLPEAQGVHRATFNFRRARSSFRLIEGNDRPTVFW
jgi:hypothetical protein